MVLIVETPQKIEIKENKLSIKELFIILLSWIFLWLLQNYFLFWTNLNWISFLIFMLFYYLVFAFLSIKLNIKITNKVITVWALVILISIFKLLRAWETITLFNNLSIIFLNLLIIVLILKENFEKIKLSDYILWYINIIFWSLFWLLIWLENLISTKCTLKLNMLWWKWNNIFKWILMTIPLIFIFIQLFSSADIIFKNILDSVFNFDFLLNINIWIRLINILIFIAIFTWIFTYLLTNYKNKKEEIELETTFDDKKHIEINIMLFSIVVLFLFFIILQINYLFAWEQIFLNQWYTYSEYAKKWFIELIITAVIVSILLWKIDDYLYSHKKISDSKIYKLLSSSLIILTIVILISAFYKLYLYINAYWLTETRFYSYMFIVILWISLLMLLVKMYKFIKEWHFIIIVFSFYLAWLLISNIINPESFISDHNLNKIYKWRLSTDYSYIQKRSSDAIDNVIVAYKRQSWDDRDSIRQNLCDILKKSKNDLTNWKNMNYSTYKAYKKLLPLESELNCTIDDNKNILR